MIELVAFLGNPGKEYAETRHNTARLFENSLPFASKIEWNCKFNSEFATIARDEFAKWVSVSLPNNSLVEHLYFLKPGTYMNLSGDAIGSACRFYKIKPENVLIVHDEIELPLGSISLKWSGGLGGHNGLRSTKAVLGTADFWRLRIGIGRPSGGDVAGYVLGKFTTDERVVLSQVTALSADFFANLLLAPDAKAFLSEWGKKILVQS